MMFSALARQCGWSRVWKVKKDDGRLMIGTAPRDWDEACHAVSDAYFPHTLTPLSRHAASGSRGVHHRVGTAEDRSYSVGSRRRRRIRSSRCLWGEHPALGRARVGVRGLARALDAGCCRRYVHPTSRRELRGGVRTARSSESGWTVSTIDREMEKVLGRPGMHLPDQVDLRGDDGARWLKFVRSLSDQILGPVGVLHNDLWQVSSPAPWSRHSSLPQCPKARTRCDTPGHVSSSGCSTRCTTTRPACGPQPRWRRWRASAYGDCRRDFGSTWGRSPSECLLDIRLERVHADLVDADDSTTVTDVAVRWGFTHTGRFASSFRRKYGLLPSEVLRR